QWPKITRTARIRNGTATARPIASTTTRVEGEWRVCDSSGSALVRATAPTLQSVCMLLTEIDHVAIAVNDLEAAIEFYRSVFGAEVEHREVVEIDGVEEALLKVADSYLQLLTPT